MLTGFLASEFNKSWTRHFSRGPSERFNRRGLRGESKKFVKCNDGVRTFFVFDLDHLKGLVNPRETTRYLKHLGIEHLPPSRAPPRTQVHYLDFEHGGDGYEEPVVCYD